MRAGTVTRIRTCPRSIWTHDLSTGLTIGGLTDSPVREAEAIVELLSASVVASSSKCRACLASFYGQIASTTVTVIGLTIGWGTICGAPVPAGSTSVSTRVRVAPRGSFTIRPYTG